MALDIRAFVDLDRYFEQAETFRTRGKAHRGRPTAPGYPSPGRAEARTLEVRRSGGSRRRQPRSGARSLRSPMSSAWTSAGSASMSGGLSLR